MVYFLLTTAGADPTLQCCASADQYQTARRACEAYAEYLARASAELRQAAVRHLFVLELLDAALPFWKDAP